jgi:hypothetical protein
MGICKKSEVKRQNTTTARQKKCRPDFNKGISINILKMLR